VEKLDFIDSKFRFAILAAKRAKQLVSGAKKKVLTTMENPLTIAMSEISQGKIKYKIFEDVELPMEKEETVSIFMAHEDEDDEDSHPEDFLYSHDDDTEDDGEETL
jgi:DNA-directed RNA polymerase subunit omega